MKILSEFDIIQRYFTRCNRQTRHVDLGIGDDAALLRVPDGHQLVISVDTLVEGQHFFADVNPADLGYKSLAVSISDMAAMSAQPFSALLSLSMPKADSDWLKAFSQGFFNIAETFSVDLVGGDLSRGPLSITTVVNGFVPNGSALHRSGASVGDLIYVTGTLGDAGFALQCLSDQIEVEDALLSRLLRPTPKVSEGIALRGIASSAMDISDGLLLDLSRLCHASGVGARIDASRLPLSAVLRQHCHDAEAWQLALTAGDDYELLFTIPSAQQSALAALDIAASCVGEICSGDQVRVFDQDGATVKLAKSGYQHFD